MNKPARGRPPQYDRDEALRAAMETFHKQGFAGTSLDDLAGAMHMSRPSMYNAFGNKAALYRHSLDYFIDQIRAAARSRLDAEPALAPALAAFYGAALDVYFEQDPSLGCFVFCTAPAEAIAHPEVADVMRAVISEIDDALARRFQRAREAGQLPADRDCREMARLAQSVLHGLALRARAGASRRTLNRMVKSAVTMLCAGT